MNLDRICLVSDGIAALSLFGYGGSSSYVSPDDASGLKVDVWSLGLCIVKVCEGRIMHAEKKENRVCQRTVESAVDCNGCLL